MSTLPGQLGSYPVERELGRGGMGVVYLGRDTRLDRPVAIKVLPDALALNSDSLARFEREAKLLAALNHPNIASIYGVEDANGQRLLVMEYVPGDTLAARVSQGPLPLDEAIDICRQIASAVEAAHEASIIHRDLKPGNVKITPDGQVKVLDFGLAKGGGPASGTDLAQSPTLTYSPTGVGVILGTAGYMSPEQARGRTVDRRTDIWSFGCVLYECLTGREPFGGETVSDAIARILEREPDFSLLPPAVPTRLRDLLRRCFEKDVKKRQRDIGDVRLELEDIAAGRASAARSGPVAVTAVPSSGSTALRVAVWLVLGAIAGAALWAAFGGSRPSESGPRMLSIQIPPSIRFSGVALMRDGGGILVSGVPRDADGIEGTDLQLFVRRFDDYEFKPIPGTMGLSAYSRSPDGAWLALRTLVSKQSSEMQLVKVPVDGGAPPVKIADWDPNWTSFLWGKPDELLVLDNQTHILRVAVADGRVMSNNKVDTGDVSAAPFLFGMLPDRSRALLSVESWGSRGYQSDIWMLDPNTGKASLLVRDAGNPWLSPTGELLFSRGSALMASAVDLGGETPALTGEAVAVLDGLRANSWSNGAFQLSATGDLVYVGGGRLGTDRRLMVADSGLARSPFTDERRAFEASLEVSPDGRQAAVVIANAQGTFEIWVAQADRPDLRRVASSPSADNWNPIWSPDNRWLAFARTAISADDGIYVQPADGSGQPRAVFKRESLDIGYALEGWLDASTIIFSRSEGAARDLMRVSIASGDKLATAQPLRATSASECCARVSPNGKLIAFSSDEAGRMALFVAPLGADGTIGRALLVSYEASTPRWAADSKRLYFGVSRNRVMVTSIDAASDLRATTPELAYDLKALRADDWTIMPDGRLLEIERGQGEDDVTSVNVIVNWVSDLRARLARVGGR